MQQSGCPISARPLRRNGFHDPLSLGLLTCFCFEVRTLAQRSLTMNGSPLWLKATLCLSSPSLSSYRYPHPLLFQRTRRRRLPPRDLTLNWYRILFNDAPFGLRAEQLL